MLGILQVSGDAALIGFYLTIQIFSACNRVLGSGLPYDLCIQSQYIHEITGR